MKCRGVRDFSLAVGERDREPVTDGRRVRFLLVLVGGCGAGWREGVGEDEFVLKEFIGGDVGVEGSVSGALQCLTDLRSVIAGEAVERVTFEHGAMNFFGQFFARRPR